VDEPHHDLFPRSRFALQEDGGVGGGHPHRLRQYAMPL
jgi:hypothetical protein